MATLEIKKQTGGYFRFILDGDSDNAIIDNAPNLTSFGNTLNFKTKNGANIIKKQFILFSEVTYIDDSDVSFTFASIDALWLKLISEGFFDGLGTGGGGGGVDRFDDLLDTFDYIGNDGKVPVVDQAQLKLVPTLFYNFNEFTQLEDVEISSLIAGKILSVQLILGVPKIVLSDPPADPVQLANTVGFFNIADLITQSTPLNYSTGDLVISNDGKSTYTTNEYKPFGVSSSWNPTTSRLDFSELSVGDEVIITVNIKNTTTTTNQIAKLSLTIGEGTASERTLELTRRHYKGIVTNESINGTTSFFISDENIRDAPSKILYSGDNLATLKVDNFLITIIRKGINVIDIHVPATELISTDDNNAIVEGVDGRLFVDNSTIPTNIRSTSFINGSGVTINAGDNTKFDINVFGKIINPDTFEQENITVNLTAQTVVNLATQTESYVWVDSLGSVVQDLNPPSPLILDSIVGYWVLVHSNLTNLNTINPFPFYEDGIAAQLAQVLDFIGFRKYPGTNKISVGTTGSRLSHTGGLVIRKGGGNTSKRPVFNLNGVTDTTFRMRTQIDTEGADTQTFDTTNYNPSGSTVTAMTNNKFTAAAIWKFSSSLVRAQYGQVEFDNLPDAIARYNKTGYVPSPNGQRNGILISWILFKKGITLSTAVNGVDYIIIDNTADSSAAAGLVATLQAAYDVSTQPQITPNDTKGSLDIRSGMASNTSKVMRWLDNTGAEKLWVKGDGTNNFSMARIVSTGNSSSVTGTTATTIVVQNILIPANTVKVGDIVRLKCRPSRTVPTSGNTGITMSISPTLNDSVANLIGGNKRYTGDVLGTTNRYVQCEHDIFVKSASLSETISYTTFFDNNQTSNKISNNTDWTLDQYFYILLNNAQTDTVSLIEGYSIEIIRQNI